MGGVRPDAGALPGTSLESIDHQHLLRAMDALVEHKAEVDNVMASLGVKKKIT